MPPSDAARQALLQRASIDPPGANGASSLQKPSARSTRHTLPAQLPAVATLPATTAAFLREPEPTPEQPNRRSRAWGGISWLAGLMLVALLCAQVLLQQRDWLAARAPASAPLFKRACVWLDCEMAPLREIDAFAILSSSLTRLSAPGYRLSMAVANRSDLTLSMPAIELTLLDQTEHIALRRVLLARDLGAGDQIAAHGEWAGAISFDLADFPDRIGGYRVLAFYP